MLNDVEDFRQRIAALPREEILELLEVQDPDLVKQVKRIEYVFDSKLTHLTWDDGSPIEGREVSNYELALLIDQPFEVDPDLTAMGLSTNEQHKIHIAKDPVTWAKHFLNAKPRVYQIIMLRHPSLYKVLRAGRRLGKTWTMAVTLLHYSYTTAHAKSIVVTPMKPQAGLIYEEIMKLVSESEVVGESVTRNVTSPQYEIAFTNGSTIRFFTSGMKSGGKSDVTRGQEAHLIVLDELDYMGDDDLEALFAMMQKTAENQVDKRMIGASTPSGRRAIFWDWCHGDIFTEFWFPSYCNPFWDKKMENFFRDQYTEMGYRHEIEADWGEHADGVYPRRYLDRAFSGNWQYVPGMTSANTMYVMGVDWDKYGAGTNIVVLEVHPTTHQDPDWAGHIKVCYREETIREEYALTKAVDRIIELDGNFRCKHIYVDRGFGEVQVELLHKYGKENPMSGMAKKVKGVAFNEMIEMRDPFSKEKVKKEIKPFMVDNLRQFLEKDIIHFPEDDEEFYKQLLEYFVARHTAAGRPVFEAPEKVGDHAHDALILAAYAITDNYGELMKVDLALSGRVISNKSLLPMEDIEPGNNSQEEKLAEQYGLLTAAPMNIRRKMTPSRKRGRNSIRRSSF